MIHDVTLDFVQIGAPLSLVGGAGVGIPSNVIDILGSGQGTAPQNIIGTRTLFGADMGIGSHRAQVDCATGTAFTTANAATLNVQFQAAADLGVGGGYLPGAWQTLMETGPLTAAQLAAATVIARFDFPPAFPLSLVPRYLRLLFSPLAATNFTAGTIAFAIVTRVRDDQSNKQAAKGYVV
jgi:hypothetical protein